MPLRKKKDPPDARLIIHNIYVGQPAEAALANLARLDDRFSPDAFVLQESARLQGRTLRGFETIEDTNPRHRDDGNNRVLVRKGLRIGDVPHLVQVKAPNWRGPKHGLEHPPRLFVGTPMRGEPRGDRFNVLSIHRMPGGPTSRLPGGQANWAAEHDAIVSYARQHDGSPLVLGADWNCRVTNRHPLSVTGLARRIRGVLGVKGIDGVITRGFKRVRVRRLLRRYGSDGHRPVVVDLWFK